MSAITWQEYWAYDTMNIQVEDQICFQVKEQEYKFFHIMWKSIIQTERRGGKKETEGERKDRITGSETILDFTCIISIALHKEPLEVGIVISFYT